MPFAAILRLFRADIFDAIFAAISCVAISPRLSPLMPPPCY